MEEFSKAKSSLTFHERYERGKATLFACQYDQRFSYYAYVPSKYDKENLECPLVVVVHGSDRTAEAYRNEFIDFSEDTNTIILAPLFPAGINEPRKTDFYDFIYYGGVRYDKILLAMIEEVKQKYRISNDRFLLYGFSSGGQFAHRFYYLHPEHLLGVSIGAPGWVTLLDNSNPWHVGTKDFKEIFNKSISIEKLRGIPVQMVIGEKDISTELINDKKLDIWMDGMERSGENRLERLKALKNNYVSHGIKVRFDTIPDVGHEDLRVTGPVKDFFKGIIESLDNASFTQEEV